MQRYNMRTSRNAKTLFIERKGSKEVFQIVFYRAWNFRRGTVRSKKKC